MAQIEDIRHSNGVASSQCPSHKGGGANSTLPSRAAACTVHFIIQTEFSLLFVLFRRFRPCFFLFL